MKKIAISSGVVSYNRSNFIRKENMDYRLNLESPWDEVKQKIQEINIDITDEDLHMEAGGEKELLQRLARKMNKNVVDVKAWIESISHNKGVAG